MLTVADTDLIKLREADILKMVLLQYELEHPREKALEALAAITGLSVGTIHNARSGKGSIGVEAWNKINSELFDKWYETKKRAK